MFGFFNLYDFQILLLVFFLFLSFRHDEVGAKGQLRSFHRSIMALSYNKNVGGSSKFSICVTQNRSHRHCPLQNFTVYLLPNFVFSATLKLSLQKVSLWLWRTRLWNRRKLVFSWRHRTRFLCNFSFLRCSSGFSEVVYSLGILYIRLYHFFVIVCQI
jgi:hypothetical protein